MKLTVPNTKKGEAEVTYASLSAAFLVNWVPGNMTHYRLLFLPLTRGLCVPGFEDVAEDEAFLVTWLIPGESSSTYIFTKGGYLDWTYVHEKLCYKKGTQVDASELCRIIGLVLDRKVVLCTDEEGRYAQV